MAFGIVTDRECPELGLGPAGLLHQGVHVLALLIVVVFERSAMSAILEHDGLELEQLVLG